LGIGGYTGKILYINLTERSAEEKSLNLDIARKFLGGRGLGAYFLLKELKPHIDPLSPENKVIFATSPLNGTEAPSFVKCCVVTKSPLTNTILMTLAGGFFAAELKFAGYDAIIVEGKSNEPCYIWIENGHVTFKDASHLWGMTTSWTQHYILKETDPRAKVACIGPAGEKLVKYASIIFGERAAGRGGAGAVLGSKNLKAIAVKGDREVKLNDPQRFKEVVKKFLEIYASSAGLKRFGSRGTPRVIEIVNELGILPTKNYQISQFEAVKSTINSDYHQKFVVKKSSCYRCPVACGNVTLIKDGAYAGAITHRGPEYETLWAFGPQCGNSVFEAIVAANMYCDEYGLDTISTGNCIGFAMECFEKKIITELDTDGLNLSFGNHESMVKMIKKIAYRDGFGNLLAEGIRNFSRNIGKNSQEFAMEVKRLELPAYDPRGAKAMGIEYATSPRGGCHERGLVTREVFCAPPPIDRFAIEGKAEVIKEVQDEMAVLDSLGFCVFVMHNAKITMGDLAELYTAATGFETSERDLWKAGERIWNLERIFNIREGFTYKDDTLPKRLLIEPIPEGPSRGHVVELHELLKDYYKVRGWNNEGIPEKWKLDELDLEE
jgi:aldehyde:ferredoxin oxidoreductase